MINRPAAIIDRRFMEAMTSDVVALSRLILTEGVRFLELAQSSYQLGVDRVSVHLASILVSWRRHGLVAVDDPDLTAVQFLDAVRGVPHLRTVAELPRTTLPPLMRAASKPPMEKT